MKNLILIILVAVCIIGCEKDEDHNNNNNVIIKGEISITKKSGTSLSDANKIFVVNVEFGLLIFEFVDIVDGSFSHSSEIGIAKAMVFLDENNQYIGTLSPQGLNLLPLCKLSDGESTIIDLETLTLIGTTIIPTHDPLGNEIIISEAEINSLKEVDGYFESLAKNIDADNDGVLDVINNNELFFINRFNITEAGHWGTNSTSPDINDNALNSLAYALEVHGGSAFHCPDNVELSGPVGITNAQYPTICLEPDGNGGFFAVILSEEDLSPFQNGTYTITIDDNPYTLDYTSVDAITNLIIVIPTLYTNDEGKLVSISLEYRLANGNTVDPTNILLCVGLQFVDLLGNQFYDTPRLVNKLREGDDMCVEGLYSYTLDNPLDISDLVGITIGYEDLVGNAYAINWSK